MMIAERAKVSIATVYNHFPGSTAEIYIEVGNRLVDSAAEATREVLSERPVVVAEFLPVAVCSQVAKQALGVSTSSRVVRLADHLSLEIRRPKQPCSNFLLQRVLMQMNELKMLPERLRTSFVE